MLMAIGPARFQIAPMNATRVGHKHASAFAEKAVIGARPLLEFVGEGHEEWKVVGTIFPHKFGGLGDLELLRQARASGRPQYMMRGDGRVMGWVVILDVTETSSYLSSTGVGRVIEIEVTVRRSERPSGGSFFSIMKSVFEWLT